MQSRRQLRTSTQHTDDDVSLMDDGSEGLETGERLVAGPSIWEDVSEEELATVAANIARHAMPSAIGLELGGTSETGPRFAARGGLDDANTDPLGMGTLDLQSLVLVCYAA